MNNLGTGQTPINYLIGQPNCLTWTQLTLLTDPHLLTDNQLELPMALIEFEFWITQAQLTISDPYPRQLGYHVTLHQLGPISAGFTK